jgi:hypothetical protein
VLLKRSGVSTVMTLATRAYWTRANRRPSRPVEPGQPTSIGDLAVAALPVPKGAA